MTVTLQGCFDHTDSLGGSGRYGSGDMNWMTAGRGIVHGEMFPLLNKDKPNPSQVFQIWLNLPKKSKMVEPTQSKLKLLN
jgi:redox-sensitive bicupin YhaK (pirin superfamily)